LRKNRTADEYGFDRDDNLCYILTEDDYKTYPQRHEAFSSFMQIAMLSGKFCLIGFSGTDPNYLSWLDWMKGVISKKNSDQQQKETQDSQETLYKVYLASVSKDDQTDVALQMYYDNHRVAKLNLFDKSVLAEIGLPIEEDNTPKEWSCGEVLTAFFRYLHGSSEDLVVKEFTERYSSLWRSVEEKLKTRNYEAEINEIVNIKKNARFFKSFSFQKEIAQYLYNKRKDWNELEKETFLLALQDAGLTVDLLFDKIDDDIKKIPLCKSQMVRAATLRGDTSSFDLDNKDHKTYEEILRCLFHLDYDNAKQLIQNWDAKGFWVLNKAAMLAWFDGEEEKALKSIDDYINSAANSQERLIASQLGNLIARQMPTKYSYEQFRGKCIDGLFDILNSYIIDPQVEFCNPTERGMVRYVTHFGSPPEQGEFERSFRTLQFIIDSGMPLEYKNAYMLNVKKWYFVCSHLFAEYPYPCFYYSIQYNDEKALTRIGQDYASCKNLQSEIPNILIGALNASGKQSFPAYNLAGLYYMTAQMYIAVDDTLWYEIFCRHILSHFLSVISSINRQDAIYKNVAMACVAMENPKYIMETTKMLLQHFHDNSSIVSNIVCKSTNLPRLKGDKSCEELLPILAEIIEKEPIKDTAQILYTFSNQEMLDEEIKTKISAKIEDEVPKFRQYGKESLFYLCKLPHKSEAAKAELKNIVISNNPWDNGKRGNAWAAVDRLPLQALFDDLSINEEDAHFLALNLSKNITELAALLDKHHGAIFFDNYYASYINDARVFVGLCKKRDYKIDFDEIENAINVIQSSLSDVAYFTDMLASNEIGIFSKALDYLLDIMHIESLENHLDEFRLLLNRAMLKNAVALNKLIRTIFDISHMHKDDLQRLDLVDSLTQLLRIMCMEDTEYAKLDFNLYGGFNDLYFIAKVLKSIGNNSAPVTYWLTDPFVLKYVKNK